MDTLAVVTRLYDYGWLGHDRVLLPHGPGDRELIDRYVASPDFHTSFLPGDGDETGLHGPFVAGRIASDDFVPLLEGDLEHYLESVQFSYIPADNATEQAKIVPFFRQEFERGRRCYVLTRNENDTELFHEWGGTLCIFREFLFVGDDRDGLDRYVIGYD